MQNQESFPLKMALAGCSAVIAGTFTNPLDLVKIRLQIDGEKGRLSGGNQRSYNNFGHAFKQVVKNEGFRGLFKGVTASQIREGSYSTLRLGLYEPFKELLGATDPAHTPFWLKLLAGGMSGFVGSALANPTDICKVRM